MKKKQKHTDRIVFRMGKRIYLRPVLKEDLPQITIWINDPEITQFLAVSAPMTPEDEEHWFNKLREHKTTDAIFAIVLEQTDELIGLTGLHRIDHMHGLAVTGSYIGRKDLWSQGYGSESKMLLLDYAFNTLNLRKICSNIYDFNPRSKRAQEKCGYVLEGVRKAHKYRNGRYADEYNMAVFKETFLPLWKKFSATQRKPK